MTNDGTIARVITIVGDLLAGRAHDRHSIARTLGVGLAAADRYMTALAEIEVVRIERLGRRKLVRVPNDEDIAADVRRMRAARGWTQTELAGRVGVSQQQIARLEKPGGNPALDTLAKVAQAFNRRVTVRFE